MALLNGSGLRIAFANYPHMENAPDSLRRLSNSCWHYDMPKDRKKEPSIIQTQNLEVAGMQHFQFSALCKEEGEGPQTHLANVTFTTSKRCTAITTASSILEVASYREIGL